MTPDRTLVGILIAFAVLLIVIVMLDEYYLIKYFRYLINCAKFKDVLVNFDDNPMPIYKQWKVIFLYSHAYDKVPDYHNASLTLMAEYCKRYNYILLDIDHSSDNQISPYWLRVKDLYDLSNYNDDNTIFVYMDIDTCINPKFFDTPINNILHSLDSSNTWNMYIGKDTNNSLYINSGVIIVKNTNWSNNMLRLWWSKYNPDNWIVEKNKWRCTQNNKACVWAGDNYEQGELENIYNSNVMDAKSNIAVCHMSILSNELGEHKNTFIYHLMGNSDARRNKFFNKLLTDYVTGKF